MLRRPAAALALLLALATRARAAPAPVAAPHGMVASTRAIASQVGADVLARGGNAVDAAVAVALALAVTWPRAGNLGGGGFLLLRGADGHAEVIDYRERAPAAATRDMYLDARGEPIPDASVLGARAAGVPGTVAGLALAHQRHGKLPWATLVEPARRLAAEGFLLDEHEIAAFARDRKPLESNPEARRIFLRDGHPFSVGERLLQPELAATLARLAQRGPRDFYEGETARLLVAEMQRSGGLVTAEDLRAYRPVVRAPLVGHYRGREVLTVPPPSSGGVMLLEMLGMLERFDVRALGFGSSGERHLLVEVMKRAFADRAAFLGDPDFARMPVEELLAPRYLAARARSIDPARAVAATAIAAGRVDDTRYVPEPPRGETTHFSIVDAEGNAVSNTFTLNGGFGCGVVVRGAGFLLNDEMDDFSAKAGAPNRYGLVQSAANAIAPGKRPLSAMTPTIVLRDGKVEMVLGSPGGPTIINTVLQLLVDTIDHGMNLAEAVAAPRVHHQWLPDEILVEPYGVPRDVRQALERRGQRFAKEPAWIGDAQIVGVDAQGLRVGVADPRLGGRAVGY